MTTRDPITWRPVLLLMGGAVALCVSVSWALLGFHEDRPHEGVVTVMEMTELSVEVSTLHKRVADLTTIIAVLSNEVKHLREDRNRREP